MSKPKCWIRADDYVMLRDTSGNTLIDPTIYKVTRVADTRVYLDVARSVTGVTVRRYCNLDTVLLRAELGVLSTVGDLVRMQEKTYREDVDAAKMRRLTAFKALLTIDGIQQPK